MEHVATLLTDVPLDESRFHGVLHDVSRSALAGAISPRGLEARHSYGDADLDADVRDVRVIVRGGSSAHPSVRTELRKAGFVPETVLDFESPGDVASREDAWALLGLYAEELRGWVLTRYVDYDEAVSRTGTDEGILRVPMPGDAGRKKAVLIAASTLRWLAP